MLLKEKGRYYELPIIGNRIQEVVYSGIIRLVFSDDDFNMALELLGRFEIKRSNRSELISSRDKETLLMFCELVDDEGTIADAKVDKQGYLYLTFSNKMELVIDNGSCDEWYFHKKDKGTGRNSSSITGGMGYLDH